MDRTVRDAEHLIMLGVLTAQSANESAPVVPRHPDRFHGLFSRVRSIARATSGPHLRPAAGPVDAQRVSARHRATQGPVLRGVA